MNRPSFEKTVDVLVKAYLNGTLEHSLCSCAVHNIISSHYPKKVSPLWVYVFVTSVYGGRVFHLKEYQGAVKKQIDRTGYTPYELSEIEYAFEKDRSSKDVFGCLMNVVEVLANIHNVDLTVKEQAKQLFVKV